MREPPLPLRPEDWLVHAFSSRAAADGGLVRRKTRDIERIVGRERFRAELDRHRYWAVENGGRTIIFCSREPLRPLRQDFLSTGGRASFEGRRCLA